MKHGVALVSRPRRARRCSRRTDHSFGYHRLLCLHQTALLGPAHLSLSLRWCLRAPSSAGARAWSTASAGCPHRPDVWTQWLLRQCSTCLVTAGPCDLSLSEHPKHRVISVNHDGANHGVGRAQAAGRSHSLITLSRMPPSRLKRSAASTTVAATSKDLMGCTAISRGCTEE